MLFLSILIVSFSDRIEIIKVKQNANPHLINESPQNARDRFSAEISSSANPPTIIGMLKRKLYSADCVSSFPKNKSVDIVVPERDNPGKTAKPCAKPTAIADL